jgi:hypothetical protein
MPFGEATRVEHHAADVTEVLNSNSELATAGTPGWFSYLGWEPKVPGTKIRGPRPMQAAVPGGFSVGFSEPAEECPASSRHGWVQIDCVDLCVSTTNVVIELYTHCKICIRENFGLLPPYKLYRVCLGRNRKLPFFNRLPVPLRHNEQDRPNGQLMVMRNAYCTSQHTLNDFFFSFCYFRTFLGANDAPRDWLQYVLWIGSQTKFLMKLWTFEKSPVCMATMVKTRFAMTKLPFAQKPTPAINFWTLKIGLSCSARVRRLTSILRRAHVTIFIIDYRDFQSQLTRFSRIFEDFDWAPVIFTQDVQRKTYGILL